MKTAIQSPEHWTKLRAGHVGASEVGALFGYGFKSRFNLWHIKHGDLQEPDLTKDPRVVIGRCVEEGIARAAVELLNVELMKATEYAESDAEPGLGATADFLLPSGGPVEIKNVAWEIYRDEWTHHDDGTLEPPAHVDLQLQAQIECLGVDHGMILALVAGNTLQVVHRQAHPQLIGEIRRRVHEFWESVRADQEPEPDFSVDLKAMQVAWANGASGEVDMSGEKEIEDLINAWAEWNESERQAANLKDTIRANLFALLKDYSAVRTAVGRVSLITRPPKPERLVTYKPQPEQREIRITPKKAPRPESFD